MSQGTLFLISAPSGAGKTSLVQALTGEPQSKSSLPQASLRTPKLCVSISHTTRTMRPGEVDGVNYHFVSPAVFNEMQANHDFLENAKVFDHMYGTSKSWVNQRLLGGWDVILEIDWQGAAQVQKIMPSAVSIFILPPSLLALKERLTNRGQDNLNVIESRMAQAVSEISHHDQADFLLINDNFELALAELRGIIMGSHLETTINSDNLQQLLKELLS